MSLDRLVDVARTRGPGWDDERARRVLDAVRVGQDRRTSRNNLARRSAGVVSGAALVLLMLRGLGSPAVASTTSSPETQHGEELASQVDALDALGDGGYGRD